MNKIIKSEIRKFKKFLENVYPDIPNEEREDEILEEMFQSFYNKARYAGYRECEKEDE